MSEPTCLITGVVAGHYMACGDCDPCCASYSVSAPVRKLITEINSLIAERDQWQEAAGQAVDRAERAEDRFEEEERIVDRVWKAIGIETYEQAKGLAIHEIVANLIVERDAARAEVERLREQVATIKQMCGEAGFGAILPADGVRRALTAVGRMRELLKTIEGSRWTQTKRRK